MLKPYFMEEHSRHQCIIYAGAPSQKLPSLAVTMRQMMEDGYRCLYMNNVTMVASIISCLAVVGVDVEREIANNRLVLTSEPVCEGDDFNVEQMLQKLEDALNEALKDGYKGLWASGDMTWEFGSEKNFEKLVEYEWKLETLFQKRKELRGICQYHSDTLPTDVMRRGLMMHRTLFINETLSLVNPHYINAALSFDGVTTNPVLDKMIAQLCQSNSETNRK